MFDTNNPLNAETVAEACGEMGKSLMALRLELPDIVWRDVWRRWMDLVRLIDGSACSNENERNI